MKKFKKIILLCFISLIALFSIHHVVKRTYQHEGFRFEDYSSDEEAQAALEKLHPVGSDAEALTKTLENAGAVYVPITNPEYKDKAEYKNIIIYQYRTGLLKWDGWNVDIKKTNEMKILSFKIYRTYQGL